MAQASKASHFIYHKRFTKFKKGGTRNLSFKDTIIVQSKYFKNDY